MPDNVSRNGRALVGLVAVALTLTLAGCGGAAESGGAAGASTPAAPSETVAEPSTAADQLSEAPTEEASVPAATPDVSVVLGEWIVEPTPTSADAGELTFTADNQGGEEHEVVIVRAADPSDLPTDADGTVDEAQIPESDFIGEIEEFPSGEQRTATFAMDAGTYVLFCNITETEDDGEVESHFAEGMATTFAVE